METDACQECAVPYTPYSMYEWIDVRIDEDSFGHAQVVAYNRTNDTYDVMFETGHRLNAVTTGDIRRVYEVPLAQGSRVSALFPTANDGTWYPGHISAVNPDGTFAITYEDGDFAPSVERRAVRPR